MKHLFFMNHWSECINIWPVTSFGHRLIKEYIWQKPDEQYRHIGPLVNVYFITKYHLAGDINSMNLLVYFMNKTILINYLPSACIESS